MPSVERTEVAAALKRAGLQITAQRLAIYRAVHETPHSMADEIWDLVHAEIGSVSRQAVYNALNAMFEHGLIRRIQPAGSGARYEVRVDNHHHLVCRACGALVDTGCAKGKAPCLKASEDHGFVVDEAEVIYWGHCPQCQDLLSKPTPPTPKHKSTP